MYPIVLLVIVLCAALIHIFFYKRGRDNRKVVEIFLFYFLVIFVGVSGILGFIGHTFAPDRIARMIGWPLGSPFQFEVAIANLAFGILGILCLWIRGNFWVAVALGSSIFSLGAATGHIREMISKQNFAIYNIGPVLFVNDILVPIVILSLVVAYKLTQK